jgi:hypothetical protein
MREDGGPGRSAGCDGRFTDMGGASVLFWARSFSTPAETRFATERLVLTL